MGNFITKLTPEQESAIFGFIALVVQGVLGQVADGKPLTWQGLAFVLLVAVGNFTTSRARSKTSGD